MGDLSVTALLFQGVMSGLGEEFLFRGLIQTGLNNSLRMRIAAGRASVGVGTVLAALLFGGLHVTNVWYGEPVGIAVVQACFGCFVGLALGIGYERTNNLWGAVITHNVANVVNSLLLAAI
jgi:membrane protease YdiL (CAAX protease family)